MTGLCVCVCVKDDWHSSWIPAQWNGIFRQRCRTLSNNIFLCIFVKPLFAQVTAEGMYSSCRWELTTLEMCIFIFSVIYRLTFLYKKYLVRVWWLSTVAVAALSKPSSITFITNPFGKPNITQDSLEKIHYDLLCIFEVAWFIWNAI